MDQSIIQAAERVTAASRARALAAVQAALTGMASESPSPEGMDAGDGFAEAADSRSGGPSGGDTEIPSTDSERQ